MNLSSEFLELRIRNVLDVRGTPLSRKKLGIWKRSEMSLRRWLIELGKVCHSISRLFKAESISSRTAEEAEDSSLG